MARSSRDASNTLTEMLEGLTARMSGDERALVRGWLTGPDGLANRGLAVGKERAAGSFPRPRDDDPKAVRTVGVIGGGTAGYLTALALKAKRPWLEVTLVESSTVPIIGVGEATVPLMVTFLHHYLGIDPMDLYREVQPTWKLGIKFEWGPNPDGFMAPFDWAANSVGVLGSLAEQGDINAFTLQSLLMMADRTPVFGPDDAPISLMKYPAFAYHLDNERFVRFLTSLARSRGVGHIDAKIAEVVLGGPEWVDHLLTTDGRRLSFDFYVDCSGFRSLLLGKAMDTPFHSYADSLFTDSAVTGNTEHGGHIKPYTTATTMNSGWCWTIPTRESDHHGYVYSSAAISDEEAAEELARRFPGITAPRQVRFRVGRHDQAWRGNTMAIGNSYGFVEPLESSGLLMITQGILALVTSLPASWSDPVGPGRGERRPGQEVGRDQVVPVGPLPLQHPARHALLAGGAQPYGRVGPAAAARRVRRGRAAAHARHADAQISGSHRPDVLRAGGHRLHPARPEGAHPAAALLRADRAVAGAQGGGRRARGAVAAAAGGAGAVRRRAAAPRGAAQRPGQLGDAIGRHAVSALPPVWPGAGGR